MEEPGVRQQETDTPMQEGFTGATGQEGAAGETRPGQPLRWDGNEASPLPQTLAHDVFGDGFALADMHCHLDFSSDMAALARLAQAHGVTAFSNTVTPEGFLAARDALAGFPNVRTGVGLHPWWVADGRCGAEQVELACQLIQKTRFVGEVGLDFAPRREGTFETQLDAFERIVDACCAQGGKVISIHAVRSATAMLDVLERHHATHDNACILHWFSGSSQELARARELGCRFSVNSNMLATKRGRAYVRQIPPERLLLETDLPEEGEIAAQAGPAWIAQLKHTAELLGKILG